MQSFQPFRHYIKEKCYFCNIYNNEYEKTKFVIDADAPVVRAGIFHGMFIKR